MTETAPRSAPMKILEAIGIGPAYIALPVVLSLGSAVFEGISTGLLAPLLKGAIEGNFKFIEQSRVGAWIITNSPVRIDTSDLSLFILVLAAVFISATMKICFSYFADRSYAWRLRTAGHNLRALLFSRCLRFGKLFFDKSKQGELHNVVLGFTDQVMERLQAFHGQIKWAFMLVAYVALMLVISWELTFFVALLFPVYHFALSRIIRKIRNVSQDYAKADNFISNNFYNVISNIGLVKAYNMEEAERGRFAERSRTGADLAFSIDSKVLLLYPIQEFITLVSALLLVCFIAIMVVSDPAHDVSAFLVYMYLLKRLATAFATVGDFRGLLAKISGLLNDIAKLLDDDDKHMIPSGERPFRGLEERIEFRHLNFDYVPGVRVLKDISFDIERGKVTALVGPSGSGKTSLVQLLLRFYDCPKETIFADGIDIRSFDIATLRDRVALVSQDTTLFNDSLRHNICYGVDGAVAEDRLHAVLEQARLLDFVSSLPQGLDTFVGDRGVQLSGGEKQRVSIARAILSEPEILIMDEATSSLDATTERLIQEALDQLVKGRTVIVIAHRFSTLKNADRIVTIDSGQIVETGTLEDLLEKNGMFSELWKNQALFH